MTSWHTWCPMYAKPLAGKVGRLHVDVVKGMTMNPKQPFQFHRKTSYKFDGDLQKLFNTIYWHLLEQGKPAKNDAGGCFYRTDDNLACAVGCLLSDTDAKNPETGRDWGNTVGWAGLSNEAKQILSILGVEEQSEAHSLLRKWQLAHDRKACASSPSVSWSEYLLKEATGIARDYGLKVIPPQKAKVYGPNSKRYWANLLRKVANNLGKAYPHLAGQMTDGDGYCAIGAMHHEANSMPGTDLSEFGGPWWFSNTVPQLVKDTFRDVAGSQWTGIMSYNDNELPTESVPGPHGFRCQVTPDGTQHFCKLLRKTASILEHGGRVYVRKPKPKQKAVKEVAA